MGRLAEGRRSHSIRHRSFGWNPENEGSTQGRTWGVPQTVERKIAAEGTEVGRKIAAGRKSVEGTVAERIAKIVLGGILQIEIDPNGNEVVGSHCQACRP